MRRKESLGMAGVLVALMAATASGQIRITEWMYSGAGVPVPNGEFIEITNIGGSPQSLSGWSYSDNADTPGLVPLGSLGTLAPGESAILAEASTPGDFRSAWSLPASVKVLAPNTTNLGRNDAINIYDDLNVLVDRLRYGDQDFVGSIRTQNRSGNPISNAALGANDPYQWMLASNADAYGSYASAGGDLGNPGYYPAIPEPSTVALLVVGGVMVCGMRARKVLRKRHAS